ncbi:MAG: glycosyl hydrolase family 18 protein [Chitinivibrionia bacterium]|nr:glycosyl hydrolase family 18 protein [Chitinivibrionia bacterium]
MKKFLVFLAILALPAILFAKGAVIPYVAGYQNSAPTNEELSKMTHLMVFQVFPDASGNLLVNEAGHLPNWLSQQWVSNAKAQGVKVSIALGGSNWSYTQGFITATNSANINNFVNNVKNFVNQYGFDGVDIDWEFPKGGQQWRQCMDLLEKLKNEMPDKRISIAVGGDSPNPQWENHFDVGDARNDVQTRIWKADAIHLMTYDMGGVTQPVVWDTHASFNGSKYCIDAWATFGAGKPGFDKEKLFMGIALYNNQGTNGDNASSVTQKVNYCYDNGYGGVIMWELVDGRNYQGGLLSTIWNANTAKGGYTGGTTGGGGGNPTVTNYTINASAGAGGSISPNGPVSVASGASQTFTFSANSGYQINDVKINGATNWGAISSGSYTFSNVTSNQTIVVTFTSTSGGGGGGGDNPTPSDGVELADGSFGNDAWSAIWDQTNGSVINIFSQGNPLSATWTLGPDPYDIYNGNVPDDKWPFVGISFFDGNWTNVTQITINYSLNVSAYLALSMQGDVTYMVELPTGTQTKTFTINQFQFDPFDWDKGSHSGLNMSKVESISINALESNGLPTMLTVTSLKVQGLVIENEGGNEGGGSPITPRKSNTKTIKGANVNISNGKLNLSLATPANSANIVLFDLRGRVLFERNIAISANVASVALPKNISRNQAAILQIRTNSGFNLTKRVLIK